MHDFFRFTNAGQVLGDSLVPRGIPSAVAQWRTMQGKWAGIFWPMPFLRTFWQLDVFQCGWSTVLKLLEDRPKTADLLPYLAYAWMGLSRELRQGKVPNQTIAELRERIDKDGELPWRDLSATAGSGFRLRDWETDVVCLLAPECGLPVGLATHFKTAIQNVKKSAAHSAEVRRWRGRRAAYLLQKGAISVAIRIFGTRLVAGLRARFKDPEAKTLAEWTAKEVQALGRTGRATEPAAYQIASHLQALQESDEHPISGIEELCPTLDDLPALRLKEDKLPFLFFLRAY
jgi:hypothetical protein